MLPRFSVILACCGAILLNACTSGSIPAEKTLAGYRYPIAQTLGEKYHPGRHYSLSVYDEGEGGVQTVTAAPSDKNEIGNKETVTDENLISIYGRTFLYLSFYDDWTIQESLEAVFDEDGNAVKTVSVTYDEQGRPLSLEEKTL